MRSLKLILIACMVAGISLFGLGSPALATGTHSHSVF